MNSNATVDFGGLFVHVGLLIDTAYHSGLIRILLCTRGGRGMTWEIATHSYFLPLSQNCSFLQTKAPRLQVSRSSSCPPRVRCYCLYLLVFSKLQATACGYMPISHTALLCPTYENGILFLFSWHHAFLPAGASINVC